jgi:hypothetical protein
VFDAGSTRYGMECVGGASEDVRGADCNVRNSYVLGHLWRGSALPVDWCTLGGAERCFLQHWVAIGEVGKGVDASGIESRIDKQEYCPLCDASCSVEHKRFSVFYRQLQTLTRDTRRLLEDEADFAYAIWGIVESKLFVGALVEERWRGSGEFPRQLREIWIYGKGRVPGRGEVWRIVKKTGVSAAFEAGLGV